ncbi:MAG: FtsX-like permease family protein [Dehalococcoidia bacterium]|nr:FtsX-like permease family protein [Dehalococcoidia bacterium]
MTLWTTWRVALVSLGGNKLRAGLTLLGIVIGVAAVISLMAIGRGVQQSITSGIESLGTNLLFVRPGQATTGGVGGGQGSAATLTLDDAYALKDPVFAPSVVAVAPELTSTGRLIAGRNNTSGRVVGVTPEYQSVRVFPTSSGRFITQGDVDNYSQVAVLGSQIAQTLYGLRDPVGQPLRINGRQFMVVGVLKSKGGSGPLGFLDEQVLVPITTSYYRLASTRTSSGSINVQNVNVQLASVDVMDGAVQEVAVVLRLRHRITAADDFTITNQQETIATLQATTNTFVLFLGTVAGISLLVGGIGIMNIMLVSVTERTREIGIRKAMGAKRRDILLQFVSEATFLSLGGGGVGVLLGILLTRLLNGKTLLSAEPTQTAFSGDIALLALAVSAAIGLFFGIYPALRASRLHPIEALRHE